MLNRIVTRDKSWVNHHQQQSKHASMQWKHPSSPSIKKLKVTPCFGDSHGVLTAHFQKCGEYVNSASYREVLLKLRNAIHRKHPGQLLHHENARHHTAQATQKGIQELQWELLEHLPHSPDLATSDFHLFGPLKNHVSGKRFADDKEVETEVQK
jgi:histone-lysine N-methyltransferase SETMAR